MPQSTRTLQTIVFGLLWVASIVSSRFDEQMAYNADSVEDVMNILDETRHGRKVIESSVIKPWEPNTGVAVTLQSGSLPSDCADLFHNGLTKSGVYTIYIEPKQRPLQVYCDQTTRGGGWTVLQKRSDGMTSFYHGWHYYVNGFGSVSGEYWIGTQNMHALTLDKKMTLRIDMSDFEGNSRYAEYTDFKVGTACEKYKLLSLGTYSGNAGDSLTYHVGEKFSTFDQDNDSSSGNCAANCKGAWWYKHCHGSNLNGIYLRGPHTSYADGVNWLHWRGFHYSMKSVQMKIRPANFNA